MTDLSLLLAFVAAATVLTLTPGVDTVMVLRSVASRGRRTAALAAIGIALGCLVWGAAVAVGLGALLRTSELAYTVLKWAGAGYLLWQGGKLLLAPRQALSITASGGDSAAGREAFRRGLLTNLLNPKVGVFYITFLPQFVPAAANVAWHTFFLAGLHVLLTLLWFALLIMATAPLGKVLRQPAAVRVQDRLTGVVFVAFGIKLAASSAR